MSKTNRVKLALLLPLIMIGNAATPRPNRLCGWIDNPTPGNWWLIDRTGSWELATQGQPGVKGFDNMPDMSVFGKIEVNGSYGYSCGCVTARIDRANRKIVELMSAKPVSLRQCRTDRRLPKL
jgi:hypothetical protein